MSTLPEHACVPERYGGSEDASDRLRAAHELRYAFAASLAEGKEVVDIGAGEGFGALAVHAAGAKSVAALDRDAAACGRVRGRLPQADVRAGDAAVLPWEEGRFDLALLLEVLEHLHEPERAVAEAARVLRPDGLALVSVPAADRGHNPYHVSEVSRAQLLDWLGKYFSDVKLFRQGSVWGSTLVPDEPSGSDGRPTISVAAPENWVAVAAKGALPTSLDGMGLFAPLAAYEARTLGRLAADLRHVQTERDGLASDLAAVKSSVRWRFTGWVLRLLGVDA